MVKYSELTYKFLKAKATSIWIIAIIQQLQIRTYFISLKVQLAKEFSYSISSIFF